MKSSSIFAAIAAVAASATIPMSASAATQTVTNTVNGIQWQLLIDTSAKTLCVGGVNSGTSPENISDFAPGRAIAQSVAGKLVIPDKFNIDGVDYTSATIGNRAFIRCRKLTTVVFPENIVKFWNCAFWEASGIKDVILKGPAIAAAGETQKYTTFAFNGDAVFTGCTSVKRVVVGPNVKTSTLSNFQFASASNMVALLPLTTGNTSWANAQIAKFGTGNPRIIFYGINEKGTAITFESADADELDAMLDFAPLVKETLGLDTQISVTNTVTITEEQSTKISAYTFDTLGSVVFEVTSQAQYANTIAAIPGTATLIANPAKLRGVTLAVPAGRKVIVPLPNGGKYSPSGNGKLNFNREAK